ncbi:RuBisCO large subunit-binding protein subunit beta [Hibiscus syriacus]|uniref:RuBisCO large subunit-binding protein subunit beta n=1 Tax=Hibiscus syriacus TaxID=106335 RepID=A0A6A2WEK4_HIBSY|nr:RuBisCO large subunit-binding protein subunit beta [Hibiscus syriacus]
MKHSQARNCIERCFGILKARWAILREKSFYPVKTQCRLISACCLLHNFIRSEMPIDSIESDYTEDSSHVEEINEVEMIIHCEPSSVRELQNSPVVGAQTETELKEKKLRVEDALNAAKAAVEEGIVVGGGCTLLRLAAKVDAVKETLENDEQKVGADIVKRALSYPMKLIAKNAGVNGSVVMEKVLSNDNPNYGYNAATGNYEDLMAAGIIDPKKVVRCCLEHAASVARTFLTSDAVVVEIKKPEPLPTGNPMDNSGSYR